MTAIAPNLGKLFTGCTKRPATSEDIALLTPGDWISEKDTPWSWQFKNSCQDMAIGAWEGKEFFVPHHLLMVCEVIEGQVVEKFFKKLEPKFKVGDRIRITRTRTQNLSQWIGKTAIITAINGETISVAAGDGREKKHLTLKKGWYEIAPQELAQNECTQQFKVGDRIISKHPLSLGQIFEIAEYPSVFADSSVSYEWLVTNTNLALRIDQVSPIEEAEKFLNNQELCLQPDISIVEVAAIQKEQLPQDTDPSGQLTTTQVQQVSTESDSQESYSLSKISDPLQMNLLPDSQYQISAYSQHLVQIFPWLVSELDLLEFADNCFLRDSDLFDSNAQTHLSLKTLTDSLAQTTQLPSRKSSKRLQVWGIAAPGNLGMVTGTSPKTESGFSSWAITADVRATQPKPGKKTLAEIIGVGNAIVYRAAGGDRIYHEQAPCLRSPNNAGNGAYKIREYQGENYLERPINATEAEQLMGWEVGSTATGINKEGDEITISQTQRIKILGNGIIPAEITDILTAIKPMLERKLESEVPENLKFAYRQLRQKGMSHQEAMSALNTKKLAD